MQMEGLKIIEDYRPVGKSTTIYKWKLQEFFMFTRFHSNSESSKTFQSNFKSAQQSCNQIWYVKLHLNGVNSENRGWISFSVDFFQTDFSEMKVKYLLYILDNKNEKQMVQKRNKIFTEFQEWYIPKFLEVNDLLENRDKFLPNNELTVVIEITEFFELDPIRIVVPTKIPKHQLLTDLRGLFERKDGSDVVLRVGEEEIQAHKFILSLRSPVFAAMFSHQLKENKENKITIPDMDPEVCKKLLEYIYTETVIGLEEFAELLYEEADKYQLPALKERCEESFCKCARVENAVKYLVLLDRHHADKKIFNYMLNFVALNSKKIVKTADYQALQKENPELSLVIVTKICSI